jgi:VanZ family protein
MGNTNSPPEQHLKLSKPTLMLFRVISVAMLVFILAITYLANSGIDTLLFAFVRSVPYGDKLGHFFLYGLLTLILNLALNLKAITLYKWNVYLGSVIVIIFIALEELSQVFIPIRNVEYLDLVAGAIGIGLFTIICHLIKQKVIEKGRLN